MNRDLPLLSVQDIELGFSNEDGYAPALHGISFEVRRGETLAVVGESGSGKSVTSLSILQLLPEPPAIYRKGSILFSADGHTQQELKGLHQEALRKIRGNAIAMIFQEPMTSLNPVLTCGEQIAEAILAHQDLPAKQVYQATLNLLQKVRLPDPALIHDRYPHQLSGGQKQRIMIAMAMSCNPALLICDEPTTALDVTVQKSILELIRELQQENGMGVIFISHDLGLVADIADRILVMYRGEIVEHGSAENIYHSPQHPYTKALLACRPALHPKGSPLPVVSDFLDQQAINKGDAPLHQQTGAQWTVAANHSAAETCIRATDLVVRFGNTTAVNAVSLDINRGETVGLVGESGCGKTTLGRTLLRLIRPSSGTIEFEGKDISNAAEKELRPLRKKMQLIFQDPYSSLNPRMRIGEAMEEVLSVHGMGNREERQERVRQSLQQVGLSADHYRRYPHEFSGGQRQRVVIARALILRPSLVVCDESVSALDVSVQAQVLNLLNELKKELQFTALFISHDLSVVRYISDRILVMQQGRIVEAGEAEKIYHHPEHPYTRKLLEAIPGKAIR